MCKTSEKPSFEESKSVIDFWLDTRDDSIIYDFMEKYNASRMTITIETIHTFELENDE